MQSGSRRLKLSLLSGGETERRCYLADEACEVEQCSTVEAIRVVLNDVAAANDEVASRVSNLIRDVHGLPMIRRPARDRDRRVLKISRDGNLERVVRLTWRWQFLALANRSPQFSNELSENRPHLPQDTLYHAWVNRPVNRLYLLVRIANLIIHI